MCGIFAHFCYDVEHDVVVQYGGSYDVDLQPSIVTCRLQIVGCMDKFLLSGTSLSLQRCLLHLSVFSDNLYP